MVLIPITCHRCSICGRIYEEDPEKCVCERPVFVKNTVHGSFIIVDRGSTTSSYMVKCILCGSTKELAQNNIRRQHSCGCKPRSAEIIEVTADKVTYRCRKCGTAKICIPPVISYCCEDKDD